MSMSRTDAHVTRAPIPTTLSPPPLLLTIAHRFSRENVETTLVEQFKLMVGVGTDSVTAYVSIDCLVV